MLVRLPRGQRGVAGASRPDSDPCRRALHHLRDLGAAPTAEQFVILPGGGAYAPNQAVELSNWRARPRFLHVAPQPHRATANARLFLAYLAYDLPHVYFAYPRLGGLGARHRGCIPPPPPRAAQRRPAPHMARF